MVLVHLHVSGVCPYPCFMSMLNIHVSVHFHAAHHRCVRVRGGVRVRVRVHVRVRVRVRVRVSVRVRVYKCRNAGQSGIRSVRYRNKKN
jgi:hypothetical protein